MALGFKDAVVDASQLQDWYDLGNKFGTTRAESLRRNAGEARGFQCASGECWRRKEKNKCGAHSEGCSDNCAELQGLIADTAWIVAIESWMPHTPVSCSRALHLFSSIHLPIACARIQNDMHLLPALMEHDWLCTEFLFSNTKHARTELSVQARFCLSERISKSRAPSPQSSLQSQKSFPPPPMHVETHSCFLEENLLLLRKPAVTETYEAMSSFRFPLLERDARDFVPSHASLFSKQNNRRDLNMRK